MTTLANHFEEHVEYILKNNIKMFESLVVIVRQPINKGFPVANRAQPSLLELVPYLGHSHLVDLCSSRDCNPSSWTGLLRLRDEACFLQR